MAGTPVTLFHPSTGSTFESTLESWTAVWQSRGWVLQGTPAHAAQFVGNWTPMEYYYMNPGMQSIGWWDGGLFGTFRNNTDGTWKDLFLDGNPLARPTDRVIRCQAGDVIALTMSLNIRLDALATDLMFFNWASIGSDGAIINNAHPSAYGPAWGRIDPADMGSQREYIRTGRILYKVKQADIVRNHVRMRPIVRIFGTDDLVKSIVAGPEVLGANLNSVIGEGPWAPRPGTLLVFSGQSLQNSPAAYDSANVTIGSETTRKLWELGYEVVEHNNATGGTDFDNRTIGFDYEMQAASAWYQKFMFIGTGSYHDIADQSGEETAQQIYDEAGAMADIARSYGAMACIQITQTGNELFDTTDDTKRTDYNALLLADADPPTGYFDDVVDPASAANFQDTDPVTNPTYFLDTIGHYGSAAVNEISDMLVAAIQADPATYNLTYRV